MDGYKERDDLAKRRTILQSLGTVLQLPDDLSLPEQNADALDSLVCILAGKDFVDGNAVPPADAALAEKEGWIWVKEPRAEVP